FIFYKQVAPLGLGDFYFIFYKQVAPLGLGDFYFIFYKQVASTRLDEFNRFIILVAPLGAVCL
ncbi:hypothetical protein KJ785_04490, partial [Patescibacteria group bacterium]|nr:hypothetical protein [Patescibacteria group bacterium]